jgi:hypothetical protein
MAKILVDHDCLFVVPAEFYSVPRKLDRGLRCKIAAASGGEIDEERAEAV